MKCCKQLACLLVLCVFLVSSLGFCSCDTATNSIFIFYPTNGTTYNTDSVDLLIQVEQENLEITNLTYSLDNVQFQLETYQGHAGANLRIGENTLSNLSDGAHTLVIKGTGDFWTYFPPVLKSLPQLPSTFLLIQPSPIEQQL